jgi:hypothetical protein
MHKSVSSTSQYTRHTEPIQTDIKCLQRMSNAMSWNALSCTESADKADAEATGPAASPLAPFPASPRRRFTGFSPTKTNLISPAKPFNRHRAATEGIIAVKGSGQVSGLALGGLLRGFQKKEEEGEGETEKELRSPKPQQSFLQRSRSLGFENKFSITAIKNWVTTIVDSAKEKSGLARPQRAQQLFRITSHR